MSWPTMSDYQEAVQNPLQCFSDPELKSGSPALNALGLPQPVTGGFCSVYQVTSAKSRWAVRCFLHNFADQRERYAEISKYLKGRRPLHRSSHRSWRPFVIQPLIAGTRTDAGRSRRGSPRPSAAPGGHTPVGAVRLIGVNWMPVHGLFRSGPSHVGGNNHAGQAGWKPARGPPEPKSKKCGSG